MKTRLWSITSTQPPSDPTVSWCRSSLYELCDSFCESGKPMRSLTPEIIRSVAEFFG